MRLCSSSCEHMICCFCNMWEAALLSQHDLSRRTMQNAWQFYFFFFLEVQLIYNVVGFPGSSAGKESTCNSGDLG